MIRDTWTEISDRWAAWRREELFRRPALPRSAEEFGAMLEWLLRSRWNAAPKINALMRRPPEPADRG